MIAKRFDKSAIEMKLRLLLLFNPKKPYPGRFYYYYFLLQHRDYFYYLLDLPF